MDISIIVPVYNVELYLLRCLDSIFFQQFTGTFEVIAVEDGSTDNSLQLLYKYQKKENRLKVIVHPENRKLSAARTTGMNAATGNYIMHVDSDDWLLPGALECIFLNIKKTNADIIAFNYVKENSKGEQTFDRKIKKEQISTDKASVQTHFYLACWSKVVKRSLTKEMFYGRKQINYGEDLIYASEILIRSHTISLIPEVLYVYFENNQSLTNTSSRSSVPETLTYVTQQLSNLLDYYKQKEVSQNLYNLRIQYFTRFISQNYFSKHREEFNLKPLIAELDKFPYSRRTNIDLDKFSNNAFYYILTFFKGRVRIKDFLYFSRSFIIK